MRKKEFVIAELRLYTKKQVKIFSKNRTVKTHKPKIIKQKKKKYNF